MLFSADSLPLADGHPTRPGFRPAVRTSSWPQRHLTRLRRHSPALWWRPLHRRSYKYFRLSYWPGPRAAVTTLAGISAQSVFRPHPQDQPALSPTAQQPVPLFGVISVEIARSSCRTYLEPETAKASSRHRKDR